jgi:hypothetical protein
MPSSIWNSFCSPEEILLKPETKRLMGQWRNLDNTGAEGLDHSQKLIGSAEPCQPLFLHRKGTLVAVKVQFAQARIDR